MIAGILTQAQACDINLATSIKQWLYVQVVEPYNTAYPNQGASLQNNGTWKADTNGLGLLESLPDDKAIYERVPCVTYCIDLKPGKNPLPTGAGDGASWEYRGISLVCLPSLTINTDGTVQADRASQWALKSLVNNAVLRANVLPIVDHSQAQSGGLYPQIGYAEISSQQLHGMEKIAQMLDANKYRFDVTLDIRWAVSTTN